MLVVHSFQPLRKFVHTPMVLSNTGLADLRGFVLEEVSPDGRCCFIEPTHFSTPPKGGIPALREYVKKNGLQGLPAVLLGLLGLQELSETSTEKGA